MFNLGKSGGKATMVRKQIEEAVAERAPDMGSDVWFGLRGHTWVNVWVTILPWLGDVGH